jgi:hypothetical protein
MPFAPQGPLFGAQLDEDVKPVDPAIFIETEEEKELSMAAANIKAAVENPSTPLKVKVNAPYRVVHAGVAYTADDDAFEVPDDAEHKIWLQSGWVAPVKEK